MPARRLAAALLPLLAATLSAAAATPADQPCATAAHHAFDFWIGDWAVTENGKPAGSSHIAALLGGCALLESWNGTDGSRGHSLNFYDARRALWQQTWIDSGGEALNLQGGLQRQRMVLAGSSIDPQTRARRLDRISWTPLPGGRVRQLWERSTDGGRRWQTLFDGLYTRA